MYKESTPPLPFTLSPNGLNSYQNQRFKMVNASEGPFTTFHHAPFHPFLDLSVRILHKP